MKIGEPYQLNRERETGKFYPYQASGIFTVKVAKLLKYN
jgi:hypothetical protein